MDVVQNKGNCVSEFSFFICDMGFPCVTANIITHMQSEVYYVCARKVNILWIFRHLDLLLLYWQKAQNIYQTQAWWVVQK